MKKLFAFLTIAGMLTLSVSNALYAQDDAEKVADDQQEVKEEMVDSTEAADTEEAKEAVETASQQTLEAPETDQTFHQIIKDKFVEGTPEFMGIVLLCLIFGLALVIERIIYLNLATTNSKKLLTKVEEEIEAGGVDAAKELCRNTRGPVASIFFQGLDRYDEGLDQVEKAIVSYGSVLQGRLEKGLSWISLFIAIAPMLGFMGTVIGMIGAFDAIEQAGDISPTVVAGGIKVALLTTVFGLITAIILQIFYNYLIAKVESLVNTMEDATISFMDILVKFNAKK